MKKYFKKNFPNKKKFFWSIFFMIFFFLIFTISAKIFEYKKISEKNSEVKKILIWSIETYKKNSWEYPDNLNKIEESGIINNINILKNKKNIFYEKESTWFVLNIF